MKETLLQVIELINTLDIELLLILLMGLPLITLCIGLLMLIRHVCR